MSRRLAVGAAASLATLAWIVASEATPSSACESGTTACYRGSPMVVIDLDPFDGRVSPAGQNQVPPPPKPIYATPTYAA